MHDIYLVVVYPDKCTMSIVGVEDKKRMEEKISFWEDVYGINAKKFPIFFNVHNFTFSDLFIGAVFGLPCQLSSALFNKRFCTYF